MDESSFYQSISFDEEIALIKSNLLTLTSENQAEPQQVFFNKKIKETQNFPSANLHKEEFYEKNQNFRLEKIIQLEEKLKEKNDLIFKLKSQLETIFEEKQNLAKKLLKYELDLEFYINQSHQNYDEIQELRGQVYKKAEIITNFESQGKKYYKEN